MSGMLRILGALALGILFCMHGLWLASSKSHAFGFVDTEEQKAKCIAEGGKPEERELLGDIIVWCDTPEKDAACEAEFGSDYYYDYIDGKCSNIPI